MTDNMKKSVYIGTVFIGSLLGAILGNYLGNHIFNKKGKPDVAKEEVTPKPSPNMSRAECFAWNEVIDSSGYISNASIHDENTDRYPWESGGEHSDTDIFCVEPDSLGDTGNDVITLTYFADGVLTDDAYHPIDNPRDWIDLDALVALTRSEVDVVYIRNNKMHCDYEVCRDLCAYEDFVLDNPMLHLED